MTGQKRTKAKKRRSRKGTQALTKNRYMHCHHNDGKMSATQHYKRKHATVGRTKEETTETVKAERKRVRQTERETESQTDRKRDRQTHTHREREREKAREIKREIEIETEREVMAGLTKVSHEGAQCDPLRIPTARESTDDRIEWSK